MRWKNLASQIEEYSAKPSGCARRGPAFFPGNQSGKSGSLSNCAGRACGAKQKEKMNFAHDGRVFDMDK
jgi:hypothetical protein